MAGRTGQFFASRLKFQGRLRTGGELDLVLGAGFLSVLFEGQFDQLVDEFAEGRPLASHIFGNMLMEVKPGWCSLRSDNLPAVFSRKKSTRAMPFNRALEMRPRKLLDFR